MMTVEEILAMLPYEYPFLFVDTIDTIDADGVSGSFKFSKNLPFFKGHFKDRPVTPGVLIAESAAQIGVVCLGIFLCGNNSGRNPTIALTSIDMEFLKPVFPDESITVRSKKVYFRFGKLKCSVTVSNEEGEDIATGTISGIIRP